MSLEGEQAWACTEVGLRDAAVSQNVPGSYILGHGNPNLSPKPKP